MESTLEFLTFGKAGREGHRRWPDDVKVLVSTRN